MSVASFQYIRISTSSSNPSSSSSSSTLRFSATKPNVVSVRNSQADGQLRRPSLATPPLRPPVPPSAPTPMPTPPNPPPSASPPPPTAPPQPPMATMAAGEKVITMEFQRQKAKELQEYFKQKKLDEADQGPFFGFIAKNEISNGRKRAESDDTVPDAPAKAEKFAQRYTEILEDFKRDPESHGGPPDCILLCRIRELILRELGFRDIFKKVKDEENAKAITLFKDVIHLNDAIEEEAKRVENLVRGIFAGNVFDLGSAQLAELFSKDGMSFLASCQNIVPRPWVIDDMDNFISKWGKKPWKKAIIFVDNSGADIVLGILPFARELLRCGTQVVLAANDLPSINDVTYHELVEIISKLKDEHRRLMGVDTENLLIANSGNDLPVIDLTRVSQELAYLASDADLVILEGMGRGIETNLYAQFKCDSLKIGMVKHPEVAQFLGGRLYDCVFKFNEASS